MPMYPYGGNEFNGSCGRLDMIWRGNAIMWEREWDLSVCYSCQLFGSKEYTFIGSWFEGFRGIGIMKIEWERKRE